MNAQWGTPLGMGLAVVHAALSADVKEASRRAARDLRQLHAAAHAAQQRSTEMERQVALAEAAARAEAGKGWQALQAKLSATDSQRAAASRTLAEQAAALEASERRREAAEADAAKAAKAAKAAAAKAAEAEARGREALRALEDRLRAREAALAAAETEKKELFAALREAVQSAKAKDKDNAEKEMAKHHHKANAAAAKERHHKDKIAPAALVADAPATVESKPHAAPRVAANPEPLRAIPEAPAAAPPRPPPSAGKAARDRERQWPAPPPHPVWCASPATMPLLRMAHAQAAPPVPPIAESIAAQPVAPPPARTPPRAESLTALAAEAALLPCSEEEEGSFATASGAGSGSSGAGASGASAGAESAGSTQLSGGGAHVLPLCRTPGSARKRLQMDSAATAVMASAGPAQAELVAASATRPARAERGREREREPTHHERERSDHVRTDRDRTERDRAERHHHRHEGERRHGERAERELRPSAPAPPAAIAAAPKAAAASKPRPAAAAAKAGGRDGDASTLPPAPREPLGRRSVNDMFLGLWEPSLGGVTPSVPRRAAIEAQPRLAGWMPQRVAEENEY